MKKQLFVIIIIIIAMLFAGCNGPVITYHEGYFLAYSEAGTSKIIVRHSLDGVTWEDGNFPAEAMGTSFKGIGAIADKNGLFHIVVIDKPNAINFLWGGGPTIWDTSDSPQSSVNPNSAPSGIWIDKNNWAITFKSSGKVTMFIYNEDERQFLTPGVEISGSLNSEVEGRPSIVRMNGNVLLSWRRWDNNKDYFTLVTAMGQVESNSIAFSEPKEIPLPLDTEFKAGIDTDPEVTHDHNQFYIAFTREGRGGGAGTLHGWHVVVYSSTNGDNWNMHSKIAGLDVRESSEGVELKTYINIAGRSDGTLIAAAIKGVGSSDNGVITVAKFKDGVWTSLNEEAVKAMFGATTAYPKPFALIGTGPPET